MSKEGLKRIELIEISNLENYQDKKRRLEEALKILKETLSDDFYNNVYDFSDQEIQIEFIEIVKRLFHPKAIVEAEVGGRRVKRLITKNFGHNNEDKSMVLDKIYINYVLKTKAGTGRISGVDSTEIPKAEYKSAKNKSANRLNLNDGLMLGQIDKVDEKEGNKHNIYNLNSRVSLVCGIFEENSITPIIVFYVDYRDFQFIVGNLISERAKEYKEAIAEIADVNEKIKSLHHGYRVGDMINLKHLKNPMRIKGTQDGPALIQTPRDTLSLTLGDFINSQDLRIIHLSEDWRDKVFINKEMLDKSPYFKSQIRQYYTESDFNRLILRQENNEAKREFPKI